MSFSISDKIKFIRKNKKFKSPFKNPTPNPLFHIGVFSFSLAYMFFLMFFKPDVSQSLFLLFLLIYIFSLFSVGFYFASNLDVYSTFKVNVFRYMFRLKIFKKDLVSQFGSLDEAIRVLEKAEKLQLFTNDDQLLKIFNETDKIKKKRTIVENKTGKKINRINERLEKINLKKENLIKEKNAILSSGLKSEKDIFVESPLLENSLKDISINASELKDRVLSTVGGLK